MLPAPNLLLLLIFMSGCTPQSFKTILVCVDNVVYVEHDNGTLIEAKFMSDNKCIPANEKARANVSKD